MKSILLVDVDSKEKIGNIAIRKLQTHFEKFGYDVEVLRLFYSGYPSKKHEPITIDARDYNEVWVSIIFTINKDMVKVINCDKVFFGGTGYDKTIKLPQEIDDCEQDYSAYQDVEDSCEFITRGCVKDCYFCFVRQKEGYIYQYRTVEEVLEAPHKTIRLMDNNILAHPEHMRILQELIESNRPVYFDQGMDIQLITEENAEAISKLNWAASEYIFAFDNINYERIIEEKVEIVQRYITGDWKLKFYVYVHPSMPLSDPLYRIHWLRDRKLLPYVMRDEACYFDKNANFYTDITSWCNQVNIFKKMTFEDMLVKRSKNKRRIEKSTKLYRDNI